jgi:hypothetical protein
MIRVLTIQDRDQYLKKKVRELLSRQKADKPEQPPPPKAA